MSIEKGLFQLIQSNADVQSLVQTANGQGVYWILAPKGKSAVSLPYIVLSRVATSDTYTTSGPTGFRAGLFQVDCYGGSYYDSKNVADAVRELLWSYSGTLPDTAQTAVAAVFLEKDWDMPYEEGPGALGFVYRALLQFRIWYALGFGDEPFGDVDLTGE